MNPKTCAVRPGDMDDSMVLDKSQVLKSKTAKNNNNTKKEKAEEINDKNNDSGGGKSEKKGSPGPESGEEDKKSGKFLVYTLIIIALIITGIFIISNALPDRNDIIQDSYTYNHFKFEKRYGTWFTMTQEGNDLFEIALRYGPRELEDVIVQGDIYGFSRYHDVYMTFDPTEEEFSDLTMANAEIATKLAQHFGVAPLPACTKNSTDCESAGARIISCEDTDQLNESEGIIYLNQEPGPKVMVYESCAIIQGEGEDIIKAADRFMLGYYGIME